MSGSSPDTTSVESSTGDADRVDVTSAEASSSSEAINSGDQSLLDAVKASLKPTVSQEDTPTSERESKADSQASQPEGEAHAKPEGQQDELGDLTDDELKRYAPKTQKRIKQLLGQRDEANKRFEAAEQDANNFRKIRDFAQQHDVSDAEVNGAVEITALLKTAPDKALDRLMPIVNTLLEITGRVLPPELQERVRQGYLTEEDARRMSVAERRAALTEHRVQRTEESSRQEAERRQIETVVNDAKNAASTWEASKKRTDPDWSSKQSRIEDLVKVEVYENGYPGSKAAVVKMLDRIYDKVSSEVSQFRAPKPVNPIVGVASSRAAAEPTSALEAAKLRLAAGA